MSAGNGMPTEAPWAQADADIDIGFSDMFRVLTKRKLTVIVVTILVIVISVGSALKQSTTYTSEGSILIATTAQPTSGGGQVLTTEKALAHSRPVAIIAGQAAHQTQTPDALLSNLSVSVPLDTQILDFKYTAATPTLATVMAQAFINAYLQYRGQLLEDMLSSSQSISQQTDNLRKALADAQAQISAATNPADAAAASAKVRTLTDQIAALDQKLTTLLSSDNLVTTATAQQAAPAVKNPAPITKAIAVGLFAGLVVGAAAAFVFEYFGRRRRDRDPRITALRSEVHAFMAERSTEDGGEVPQYMSLPPTSGTPPSSG